MHGDPLLRPSDAEALDRSIIARLGQPGTSIELYEMMGRMRDTFSYKRFGFETWEEYMVDRTAGYTILTVSRESLVWTLHDLGYTLQEIGAKLGVSHETARRDIKKKPEQLSQNVKTGGRTTGKDGKSYPQTKTRGKPKLTLVENEDDDEPIDVDFEVEEEWVEEEEPQDNSLSNARVTDKRPNPFMCDIDTWDDTCKMFKRMLDQGVTALLGRSPSYAEVEQVEAMLRKALVRTSKIKEEIEAAHTERLAAQ